ncbi:hypothetical protein BDZ45DRAFT_441157 [Acephala macrosclerotiorum]|nr:hypothetical protein BDZ45DRAFT_441157 [Acephala macrosclerotiorum]
MPLVSIPLSLIVSWLRRHFPFGPYTFALQPQLHYNSDPVLLHARRDSRPALSTFSTGELEFLQFGAKTQNPELRGSEVCARGCDVVMISYTCLSTLILGIKLLKRHLPCLTTSKHQHNLAPDLTSSTRCILEHINQWYTAHRTQPYNLTLRSLDFVHHLVPSVRTNESVTVETDETRVS